MKVTFIGDIHGNMNEWDAIRKGCEYSVQLGDLGVGFVPTVPQPIKNHWFIRGNHDNPRKCWNRDDCLYSYGTVFRKIFYVSGAESEDRSQRVEGFDWWRDEQLSTAALNDMVLEWRKICDKQSVPEIFVSHCAPESAEYAMGFSWKSCKTSAALEACWQIAKPKVWLYGHYHEMFDRTINGTRFICLPPSVTWELDV